MLEDLGANISLLSSWQNADDLAELFINHPDAKGPIGLPQGDRALDTLQKKLEEHGFEVWPAVIYKTVLCPQSFQDVDVIVLASPSAVEALKDIGKARLVVIGETTLKAVEARGWKAVQSPSLEVKDVLDMIEILVKKEEKI